MKFRHKIKVKPQKEPKAIYLTEEDCNTLISEPNMIYNLLCSLIIEYKKLKESEVKNMTLEETAELMLDKDYKNRFIAEYHQTKIRYEKLKSFIVKIEASEYSNVAEPNHDCSYDILRNQQRVMGEYLHILEIRSVIENIDLDK